MNPILDHLKNKGWLWQADFRQRPRLPSSHDGFTELARHIPGGLGAYPVVAIQSPIGIGELRLILPTLAGRAREDGRLVAWIAPPYKPNAESLHQAGLPLPEQLIVRPQTPKQALWATEQCLKSGACHAVLLWHRELHVAQLKRLRLASQQGRSQLFLWRTEQPLSQSLPVSLSLKLSPTPIGLKIRVNKCQGSWPSAPFELDMRQHWPKLCVQDAKIGENRNVIPFTRAG